MSPRALELETARKHYVADKNLGQYFQKTESGKAWRLWGKLINPDGSISLEHLIATIPSKRVLWVLPDETPAARTA